MMEPTTGFFGVLAGGAAVLIGKIVWDWLSSKRVTAIKHEGDCARLTALENQFHAAHLALVADVAAIKNDLNYIKRKLDLNGSGK